MQPVSLFLLSEHKERRRSAGAGSLQGRLRQTGASEQGNARGGKLRMAPGYLVNKRKTKLKCPKCKERQLARISRRGFLRVRIYPLLGLFPWQCAICGKERLLLKRSGVTPGPQLIDRGEVAESSRDDLAS
jgi:ribosomal protein L37AE/L43A